MRNLFLLVFTFCLMNSFKSNSLTNVNSNESLSTETISHEDADDSERSNITIEYIIRDEQGRLTAWVTFACNFGGGQFVSGDDFMDLVHNIYDMNFMYCNM